MAIRRVKRRTSKTRVSQIVPAWTPTHAVLSNSLFLLYLQGLGITSVSAYLRIFALPNSACTLIGIYLGVTHGGIVGLVLGGLLGLAAPGVLLWLAITVVHAAIYLAVFYGAWIAIFYVARWFLSSGF